MLGKPIFKQFIKSEYLKDILGRLEDEVGTVFSFYKKFNTKSQKRGGRYIGFWSGARLLFPIIEAVSSIIGKSKWDFLAQDLGIKPSSLTFQMFRNSLAHGDILVYAKNNQKIVRWGLFLDNKQHKIGNGQIYIDLLTLYDDLRNFLIKEIAKKDTSLIGVHYGTDYTQEKDPKAKAIIDEINKI